MQSEEERIIDLVRCIERMHRLKQDLISNAGIRNIIDDGHTSDTATWNKEIAKYLPRFYRLCVVHGSHRRRYFHKSTFMDASWYVQVQSCRSRVY